MKKILLFIITLVLFFNCEEENKKQDLYKPVYSKQSEKAEFAIVIHGGAGNIKKKNMSDEKEAAYRKVLEDAIKTGYNILRNGGSSIDAVTKTINVLEDSPLFNAGKGAVFTNTGTNEHDASIMDGKTLKAGASAATTIVKNPINLAKVIMDNSSHVILSGEGADIFAKEQGLELVTPEYFFTEKRFKSLQKAKKAETIELDHDEKVSSIFYDEDIKNSKYGTVGCVALDKNGNLAAGTSTGGMTNKRWGRIGDSPIIGAGTYANNNTCAVSCTGWGEFFIRTVVAHDISALMEYKGLSLKDAAKEVIQNKVDSLGGHGGIIAVDKNGHMVTEFNTSGMYRATMDDKGEVNIEIFE